MIQELGVVTPLYSTPENNRLRYFKDTVGSVLAQDYDFLWTIVDDGSTDQDTIDFLKDISKDPRINIKTKKRQSEDKKTASNALNIGFNFLFQNGCQYFTYYDFSSPLGMKAGFPHHTSMWSREMMELMMKEKINCLIGI